MSGLYIHAATGEYPLSRRDIAMGYPEVSFPTDAAACDAAFAECGYFPVTEVPRPSCDPATEEVFEGVPVYDASAGAYEQTWIVSLVSEEEQARRAEEQANTVRADRDRRLYACDYTVLPDAPSSITSRNSEWTGYRQALRDISSQPDFPWNVVWPEPPA